LSLVNPRRGCQKERHPNENAEFLDERPPIGRLTILDAGHFVWEEAAAEYASIGADSVAGRWRNAHEKTDR